jgi:hypothetical protein
VSASRVAAATRTSMFMRVTTDMSPPWSQRGQPGGHRVGGRTPPPLVM